MTGAVVALVLVIVVLFLAGFAEDQRIGLLLDQVGIDRPELPPLLQLKWVFASP